MCLATLLAAPPCSSALSPPSPHIDRGSPGSGSEFGGFTARSWTSTGAAGDAPGEEGDLRGCLRSKFPGKIDAVPPLRKRGRMKSPPTALATYGRRLRTALPTPHPSLRRNMAQPAAHVRGNSPLAYKAGIHPPSKAHFRTRLAPDLRPLPSNPRIDLLERLPRLRPRASEPLPSPARCVSTRKLRSRKAQARHSTTRSYGCWLPEAPSEN